MPSRLPLTSTSAPPELPGLIAASVWMKFSKVLMPSWLRPSALTMPQVTVWPTPNGLPIASTDVAHLQRVGVAEGDHRQLVELDLEHREVGVGVGADHLACARAAVVERDLDVVGALDHVVVGEEVAVGQTITPRAEADLALLRHLPRPVAEEEAEPRVVGARPLRRALLVLMLTTAGEARLAAAL